MKKVILMITSLFIVFSSYSYAELTNHYVKQEQAKNKAAISATASQDKPFMTQILNEDPRVTNK